MVYLNPLRDANYVASDIDAGADYCITGPIYPIGAAVILHRGVPSMTSTFGSLPSVYRLLDGPLAGKMVYCAEHYEVEPGISDGQTVGVNQVIWRGILGGCIEMGWSDGTGSLAWNTARYQGQGYSAYGTNFTKLMVSLGVKPGHLRPGGLQGAPLPSGWPTTFPTEEDMRLDDIHSGWTLAKAGKPLPANANADVTWGFNLFTHKPDHVHDVTLATGTVVKTSKPD